MERIFRKFIIRRYGGLIMVLKKIWFENERIYGLTYDGKTVWQSLLWYKRLNAATDEQRNNYEMDDEGIHWYDLDEDISF